MSTSEYVEVTNATTVDSILMVFQQIKEKYGGDARVSFDTFSNSYNLEGYRVQVFSTGVPPYTEVTMDLFSHF